MSFQLHEWDIHALSFGTSGARVTEVRWYRRDAPATSAREPETPNPRPRDASCPGTLGPRTPRDPLSPRPAPPRPPPPHPACPAPRPRIPPSVPCPACLAPPAPAPPAPAPCSRQEN